MRIYLFKFHKLVDIRKLGVDSTMFFICINWETFATFI